jgi:hypothetical protein
VCECEREEEGRGGKRRERGGEKEEEGRKRFQLGMTINGAILFW